jgi:glutamate racemase
VSAYALNEMKESATCPVMGVVEAGALATANAVNNKSSNILVIGTNATINSHAYENSLKEQGYSNIQAKATPLFVPLVEEEILDGAILNATLSHYFDSFKAPDALILGCTHFPIISSALSDYFGDKTLLIHSGDAIVEYLQRKFDFYKKYQNPKIEFFASENPEALRNIANKWLYEK